MYLEEFLKHYSKAECSKLNTLIRKGDGTVKNTVLKLLENHKVDKKSQASYVTKCKSEIDQQFKRLMQEVKDFDQSIDSISLTPDANKLGFSDKPRHSRNLSASGLGSTKSESNKNQAKKNFVLRNIKTVSSFD